MKVPQRTFDELESSLLALEAAYAQASPGERKAIRGGVIAARRKALWASQRAKANEARSRKHEMAEWMLVWLENPEVFPAWIALRKRAAGILNRCV